MGLAAQITLRTEGPSPPAAGHSGGPLGRVLLKALPPPVKVSVPPLSSSLPFLTSLPFPGADPQNTPHKLACASASQRRLLSGEHPPPPPPPHCSASVLFSGHGSEVGLGKLFSPRVAE